MALEINAEEVTSAVLRRLDARLRYRCLVFQARQISAIDVLSDASASAATSMNVQLYTIGYGEYFDKVGAAPCDDVIRDVERVADESLVVMTGPLHFLDYWNKDIRSRFWMHLAAFSHGPGIIVVDVFRTECVIGPFRVAEHLSKGDIRILKSRLEATQDVLA